MSLHNNDHQSAIHTISVSKHQQTPPAPLPETASSNNEKPSHKLITFQELDVSFFKIYKIKCVFDFTKKRERNHQNITTTL